MAAAMVTSMHGDQSEGRLGDISPFGCNIAFDTAIGWLRAGRFITIEVAQGPTVQAIIRWCRDDIAGTEFLRQISEGDVALIAGLSG